MSPHPARTSQGRPSARALQRRRNRRTQTWIEASRRRPTAWPPAEVVRHRGRGSQTLRDIHTGTAHASVPTQASRSHAERPLPRRAAFIAHGMMPSSIALAPEAIAANGCGPNDLARQVCAQLAALVQLRPVVQCARQLLWRAMVSNQLLVLVGEGNVRQALLRQHERLLLPDLVWQHHEHLPLAPIHRLLLLPSRPKTTAPARSAQHNPGCRAVAVKRCLRMSSRTPRPRRLRRRYADPRAICTAVSTSSRPPASRCSGCAAVAGLSRSS